METNTKTMLAAGGILAVALTIGSQIDGTKKPVPEPVSVEVSKAVKGAEIKSMRTVNAEVFKADSAWVHPKDARGAVIKADSFKVAAFTARVYARPKYFRDTDGDTLRPLDLTVRDISALAKLNPLKTHDKYVDAGPYDARWMDDKPGDFRMDSGGAYVKYRALFKGAAAAVQATADGMKELVTLADSTAPKTLRWVVETDGSLVANAQGGFDVRAKDGSIPMRIQRPVAWDADNKPVMASATVEGDTLTFRVTVLPGQKYPVVVDPTTQVTAVLDGSIHSASEATYAGNRDKTTYPDIDPGSQSAIGQFGNGVNSFGIYRAYLMFPMSLSNVASVSACTTYVYINSDGSVTDFNVTAVLGKQKGPVAGTWADDFWGWASSGAYPVDNYILGDMGSTSGIAAGWKPIPYYTIGRDSLTAAIARGDTHRVALLSSRDIGNNAPSTNEFIQIERSSVSGKEPYIAITYTPAVPTGFTATGASTTTAALTWTNNITGETGYRIKNIDSGAYIDSVAADTTHVTITGLSVNTKYRFLVEVKGGTAAGAQSAPDSCYTLAAIPGKPTVTFPADSLGLIKLDVNGNPAYTEFAIQDSITGLYFDGRYNRFFTTTAAESILWRTYAAWGGTSGDTVKVGVGKKYNIRAKARSGE